MKDLNETMQKSNNSAVESVRNSLIEKEEEIDYTLYLGTITAIGSIFNSLKYYVINLQYFSSSSRLAYSLARCNGVENVFSSRVAIKSKYRSSTSKRRVINVNKCAVKKKRRKLKLQMFKCEHLAKLLLLESYASTDRDTGSKEVSLEEGLGIGRLILKMLKCNEHMAVEELGRRTVDFMKVCIAEIENRYIQNGMKL